MYTLDPTPAAQLTGPQTQKDLPIQFLSLSSPVDARVILGGFGDSAAHDSSVFKLSIDRNPDEAVPTVETERYGKKAEIHHIFKDAASSPPLVITLAFVGLVIAAIPVLAGMVRKPPTSLNVIPANSLSSGSSSAPMSTTSPPHSSRPLSLMLFSSDPWSHSRVSSSFTTPLGTCSRFFPPWVLLALSHSSVVAVRWVRFRADASPVSVKYYRRCISFWNAITGVSSWCSQAAVEPSFSLHCILASSI